MKKSITELKTLIEQGKFPKKFRHFGGANLIITDDPNRNFHEGDVVVYSLHAGPLSWLVEQLKEIYLEKMDYMNKYEFYPSIGKMINNRLKDDGLLFDVMLSIVDDVEEKWG